MATHDYVIDNSTGANVRADINSVLQAVLTNNSNSSSPSTTAAYMLWVDTTANIVKIRNSSDNAWINLFTTAGGVDVDAASNFNEDVTFTGTTSGRDVIFDKSLNQMRAQDNAKFCAGSSGDLEIYHNATSSYIDNYTGDLYFRNNVSSDNGGDIYIQPKANENSIVGRDDGAAELYFDNSVKLATLTNGVQITGQEFISEGTIFLEKSGAHHHRILANDTGNDLGFQQSSDTGANTNFTTYLRIKDGGDISLPVDNKKLLLGASDDLQLYHSGSNSFIKNTTNGSLFIQDDVGQIIYIRATPNENAAVFKPNAAVELFYDNSKKFETLTTGAKITGQLNFDDGSSTANTNSIAFGSSQDTRMFHDGASLQIRNSTGQTGIITPTGFKISADGSNDTMFHALQDGAVELYYDNTKRFETISDGTKIKGHDQLVSEDGNANVYKSVKYANIPTSNNITITLASLATGYGVFRMGGYGNAGQAALGLHIILGGFMTGTAYYQVDVLQNFTHANCSISLAKNAGNYVITVNNTSSSQTLICSMSLESAGGKMTQTIAY